MARGWKKVTVSSAGPSTWSICATDRLCGFSDAIVRHYGRMTATVLVRLTAVAHPWFADAVDLFDDYRQHYGANPAPDAVAAWLRDQVVGERERVYLAGDTSRAYGICSVVVIPAALSLRTVWLIRDLFVAPAER